MNVQHAPTTATEGRERHSYARLQGRWLLLGRGIWIALVILTLAIFFGSLPVYAGAGDDAARTHLALAASTSTRRKTSSSLENQPSSSFSGRKPTKAGCGAGESNCS